MRKLLKTANAINAGFAIRTAYAALFISAGTFAHAGEPTPGVDVNLPGGIAAPGKTPAAKPSISHQGFSSNLSSYKSNKKCPAAGPCARIPTDHGGTAAPAKASDGSATPSISDQGTVNGMISY